MKFMPVNDRRKTAAEVRREEGLPGDGRGVLAEVERLEAHLRTVMLPEVPIYDVDCGADISDAVGWTYGEGFSVFHVLSLSVEVNVRLALAASHWNDDVEYGRAEAIAAKIADKWETRYGDSTTAVGKRVFFPPGQNMRYLVNNDNVARAFATDSTWMCKPHPVTVEEFVEQEYVSRFGVQRVYHRLVSGMELLREAEAVGYTTASELGLVAILLRKPVRDFTMYAHEARGRYYPIYRAIRESALHPTQVIDRLLSCPWSGYVPLETPDREALKRFGAFHRKAIEIYEQYRPLTRLVPVPEPT